MIRQQLGRRRRDGKSAARNFGMLETLESRILYAAHAPKPTFDLADLSGYNLSSTSLEYDIDYTLQSNLVNPSSGSGGENVTVNQAGPTGYQVDATADSGTNLNLDLAADSDGLNLSEIDFSPTNDGTLTPFTVSGVRLLSKSARQGKTETHSGNFSGDLDVEGTVLGYVAGPVSGSCKTTSKAIGVKSVMPPAGTFASAVEGDYTIKLNGKIKITLDNHTRTASFLATLGTTFWANADLGIVQSDQNLFVSIKVPHEAPGILSVDTQAALAEAPM